jgi:hypothetical protein
MQLFIPFYAINVFSYMYSKVTCNGMVQLTFLFVLNRNVQRIKYIYIWIMDLYANVSNI